MSMKRASPLKKTQNLSRTVFSLSPVSCSMSALQRYVKTMRLPTHLMSLKHALISREALTNYEYAQIENNCSMPMLPH